MNRTGLALVALTVIIIVAAIALLILPAKTSAPTTQPPAAAIPASIPDTLVVDSPLPNAFVAATSLTATGRARGPWYFEASFPALLKDAGGNTIAQAPAQAQGDWMTNDFVPFSVTLTYPAQPAGSHGTLVLHNDNPSGDPAKDKSLSIPVVF